MGVWVDGPPSQGLHASGGQKGYQHPHPSHQGPHIAKRNTTGTHTACGELVGESEKKGLLTSMKGVHPAPPICTS